MRLISSVIISSLLLAASNGCRSATVINSTPSGATLMMNGSQVGTTPYTYADTKVLFSKQQVSLELKGYEKFDTFIQRDELAAGYLIVGVLCFFPAILWAWEYPPSYNFSLRQAAAKRSYLPMPSVEKRFDIAMLPPKSPMRAVDLSNTRTVSLGQF